ncbi:MAG: glycosyltransferase, partial [Gammaproteobacteria bacterium]
MSDKKFSFITICYNNLQGLQRTVDSLRTQHYANWQCVIIDGNSRDGTKAYLERLLTD